MQKIVNNSISGFKEIKGELVKIYDSNRILVYDYLPKNGLFNLPIGEFYTNNEIVETKEPLRFKLPILPLKQKRSFLNISDFKVNFVPNKHKATIYLDKGLIEIDPSFWGGLSQAQKDFVLCHELGHLYYESEKSADKYAMYKMLKMGYNPSQLAYVVLNTFSINEDNIKRCESAISTLVG